MASLKGQAGRLAKNAQTTAYITSLSKTADIAKANEAARYAYRLARENGESVRDAQIASARARFKMLYATGDKSTAKSVAAKARLKARKALQTGTSTQV